MRINPFSSNPNGPSERLTWRASSDGAVAVLSLYWAVVANQAFLVQSTADRSWGQLGTWGFALALLLMLWGLHAALLGLVMQRHWFKPVAAVLILTTAFATYYMGSFGVYLDPDMLRNVLRTHPTEAVELFNLSLVPHLLLHAGVPWLMLWRLRLQPRRWWPSLWRRALLLGLSLGVAVAAIVVVFQPFSSLMRNQKSLRYLITPANYLWSLSHVLVADAQGAAAPRQAIGLDAQLTGPSGPPQLLVLVVGETVRAANWGLNGYERATTPALAQVPELVNFAPVRACGTNTETSLPCMFAPVGRRDYDEARIRGSESLLHVLDRAGVKVAWRDNQSGCKGVCEGLPQETVLELNPPGLCAQGRCLDEGLLHGLPERLKTLQGTHVLVLHMLGNHGPAYWRRYPVGSGPFQPACEKDDLRLCEVPAIVNAYDNAVHYTDQVLAKLMATLKAASNVDSAMVFLSDHGESLGEKGLFLHGIPYAIAPDVQLNVPQVMWFSPGFARQRGLDLNCLKARAQQPTAHDHLFHTVLGLMSVQTALYERDWDVSAGCRSR